ncbi:hypothetical protein SKAU_G00017370 [Synaphobranchus kaupii]|uniref:Integrase zinc-binding domain-containing protein n=1 Tax=Synaphobranchus kaupii TaxID=118154 RepID=A0A9Q1GB87_SYNKA|nr:hypothetical protein SKAU_G00017370 [Synaphobranchus kaupii]
MGWDETQPAQATSSAVHQLDTLSRLHELPEEEGGPETVLPPACVVAAARLDIVGVVEEALRDNPGPSDTLRAICSFQQWFAPWTHTSRLACRPGVARTLALLPRRFWWPEMKEETAKFVAACSN